MSRILTYPNRDLCVVEGNKAHWNCADHRRKGFHSLFRISRYAASFRAANVMQLKTRADLRISSLESVRVLTSLPWFSAMVVLHGSHILYERYAADFGPERPHSVQSITKTMMNLIIGLLWERGEIDLSARVGQYVPQIGSGYAEATIQDTLNMDVVNEYTEDFADPTSTYYQHEEAMGWRLPAEASTEVTQRAFLSRIRSSDTRNRTGVVNYKDANTDVLGWVAEEVSGRPLRSFLADLTDAAGLEHALHISTDREGFPTMDGGASLTARDLARYVSLFVRGGLGVNEQPVGSSAFIQKSLGAGVPMAHPYEGMHYSNHLMRLGRCIGHGGWGGQYAMTNLDTGVVAVFLSVLENEHAINRDYLPPVIRMLEQVTKLGDAGVH